MRGKRLFTGISVIIAVLLFQVMASDAESTNWTEFQRKENGDVFFYHSESMMLWPNDVVTIWTKRKLSPQSKVDYINDLISSGNFSAQRIRELGYDEISYTLDAIKLDCRKKQLSFLSYDLYAPNGMLIDTSDTKKDEWLAIEPPSTAEKVYKICCIDGEIRKKHSEALQKMDRWKIYSYDYTGNVDYYDAESVTRINQICKIWTKSLYSEISQDKTRGVKLYAIRGYQKLGGSAKEAERDFASMKLPNEIKRSIEVNCAERSWRLLAMYEDGITKDLKEDDSKWSFISPESGMEKLYNIICKSIQGGEQKIKKTKK